MKIDNSYNNPDRIINSPTAKGNSPKKSIDEQVFKGDGVLGGKFDGLVEIAMKNSDANQEKIQKARQILNSGGLDDYQVMLETASNMLKFGI